VHIYVVAEVIAYDDGECSGSIIVVYLLEYNRTGSYVFHVQIRTVADATVYCVPTADMLPSTKRHSLSWGFPVTDPITMYAAVL
jgi:hypothetical protein